MNRYIHVYVCIRARARARAHTHTHTHTHTRYIHPSMHTHAYTYIHDPYTRSCTNVFTKTRYTRTHARTHTHTHTHTDAQHHALSQCLCRSCARTLHTVGAIACDIFFFARPLSLSTQDAMTCSSSIYSENGCCCDLPLVTYISIYLSIHTYIQVYVNIYL